MRKIISLHTLIMLAGFMALALPQSALAQPVQWINHLDFLPGDSSVNVEFNAVTCPGVGGLSGLAITSTELGDSVPAGGNKVVEMGANVPHDFLVNGVRVCYQNSSASTFINQIRLCRLNSPPDSCTVVLDDPAELSDPGPVCVNSAVPFSGPVSTNPDDPDSEGALRVSLRINTGDVADTICLRGVGLIGVAGGPPEQGARLCSDGVDNDGDGAVDCDDSDCADRPFCR
ncbi:MAG TPA: hypothetical protein VLU25_01385 [Acidobacteriota bacterium]|nr:hypothetical protein [Acidobacteriota bacterium]